MLGLMQDRPLLVSSLIEYADTVHGDTEVISRCSDGMHRGTWRSTHKRARQLAKALLALIRDDWQAVTNSTEAL